MIEPIWDIIARIIQNEEVSSQEKSLFEDWCNTSKENKKIYDRMSSVTNQLSKDKPSYIIDTDKAFYRNQLMMNNKAK